ncbi:ABC-type transport system permease protein (probable substrate dipeptide/oligopeptide) [Halobacterium hubeiense]|uniref:ABC transporter permease n=2 Tax=Halobacterium TaxID=2239 RepID=A0AAU8CDY4_9EURY|nr:ABC transporter permease [Halobacterium hubeiense]CQH61707.1 ABC-type transport system permease protein (probable substrate dipeptide/oligopeptide) [Halobacterium hubeiense]
MSRWTYLGKRLIMSIPVIILGTTLTFVIVRMGPLNPVGAILGPDANPAAYESIEQQLGLNQPLWAQYIDFMTDLFTFDLGQSWVYSRDTGTYELLATYAPRTIWLGFWSVVIAIFIGIPLGFYAGLNPNTFSDYLASFGGIVWRAMPNFWLAVILVAVLSSSEDLLFGFEWQTFLVNTPEIVTPPDLSNLTDPTSLLQAIKKIAPAALVLGSSTMGNEVRLARTAVLETVNSNYVETAKAKGLPGRTIVWKHIFRNALIPLIPVITNEVFILIGGSVLVETVFAINGIGYLFFQATIQADLPLVGSLMFIFILLIVGVNILQDILYTIVDPRVGYDND